MFDRGVDKAVRSLLDNGAQLQAPAVAKYVDRFRRAHPEDSPAQLLERLEKIYLTTVTGSGTAVGATAAVPGVGTLTSLAAMSAETTFFLEASAVYTLAVAAVHGVAPEDSERRRALVLAVVLGDTGMEIVQQSVGHSAKNWGTLLAEHIPGIRGMNESLMKRFVVQFVTKRGALMFGKVLPAGIGAAIGGFGNRALGRRMIDNAHKAFGPAPAGWSRSAVPTVVVDADPLPTVDEVAEPRSSDTAGGQR